MVWIGSNPAVATRGIELPNQPIDLSRVNHRAATHPHQTTLLTAWHHPANLVG
jgi:hypothetical protein